MKTKNIIQETIAIIGFISFGAALFLSLFSRGIKPIVIGVAVFVFFAALFINILIESLYKESNVAKTVDLNVAIKNINVEREEMEDSAITLCNGGFISSSQHDEINDRIRIYYKNLGEALKEAVCDDKG